jgi:hypothetical protein
MSTVASPLPAAAGNPDLPKGNRFTLGNKGGPGNPFARQVAEIRKLLLNTVPGDELAKILLAVVEKAKTGDVAAAKLVLQYTAGKPAEAVEPDRIELEDHRLRAASLIPMSDWVPGFGFLSVASANRMWEKVAPEMEEETLLPVLLAGLEDEQAPAHQKAKGARKTNRQVMRMLGDRIPPSPNGSIGRKLEKLRQALHGETKPPAPQPKSARAG